MHEGATANLWFIRLTYRLLTFLMFRRHRMSCAILEVELEKVTECLKKGQPNAAFSSRLPSAALLLAAVVLLSQIP